ncbi:hypothetical protein C7B67_23535 [filamentous cyanobacterium Phorm 6]|nr:hypothetical protein C7B67_23535 [filamentous cyanobacterium Phorm 6]
MHRVINRNYFTTESAENAEEEKREMNNYDEVRILPELRFSAILVADIHKPIWRTDAGRETGNGSIVIRGWINKITMLCGND